MPNRESQNGRGARDGAGPPKRRPPAKDDTSPPSNREAESRLLGAILMDSAVLDDVTAIVKPEDFFREHHELIFRVMLDLRESSLEIEPVALLEELERRGEAERIGGLEGLAELMASAPHTANAVYHAKVVADKAVTRKLIEVQSANIQDCKSKQYDSDTLIARAESAIFQISEGRTGNDLIHVGQSNREALELYRGREHKQFGVSTGFTQLDYHLECFQPSRYVVIGARPSMGKTAFALNLISSACFDSGASCMLASLEMPRDDISQRLLTSRSGIEGRKLKRPWQLDPREQEALGVAVAEFQKLKIWIDDTPDRTVTQIAAMARRLKAKENLSLLVIDYIQLIRPQGEKDNRQEQISKISGKLKNLSKELKITVVVLAQLNREVDKREGKNRRPRLSDLRESGSMEQDADHVLLLHRPDYYDPDDKPGLAEVILAKNRHGETALIELAFIKAQGRFADIQDIPAEAY